MPHPRPGSSTPAPPASSVETLDGVLDRIGRSSFRAKFHLSPADARYARERGPHEIETHAARFIGERLAAANPDNDGRQTPVYHLFNTVKIPANKATVASDAGLWHFMCRESRLPYKSGPGALDAAAKSKLTNVRYV